MIQVVIRFLTFNVMAEHPAIYWGLLAVWIILFLAAVSSLHSLEIRTEAKLAWFALICFVPLIGLLIYAFRCLLKADWSFAKPFMAPSRTTQKIAPR